MLMQYVDDYEQMFRSMLTCDIRVGIINIRCKKISAAKRIN